VHLNKLHLRDKLSGSNGRLGSSSQRDAKETKHETRITKYGASLHRQAKLVLSLTDPEPNYRTAPMT
jgi:hypothetical protein